MSEEKIQALQKENEQQNSTIKELVEALEFYGDRENWHGLNSKKGKRYIKLSDMEMINCDGKWGGKRARQALEKNKEMIKGE